MIKDTLEAAQAEQKVWRGTIIGHEVEAPAYRRMTIFAPEVARRAKAGHFIHVLPRDQSSSDPFLRRAFSIMRLQNEAIVILYRVEGRGTQWMAQKKVGDEIDFLGTLGQPFAPPSSEVLLVGGGVGVPPMVMLAHQMRREGDNCSMKMLLGARTRDDVLCLSDFAECDVAVEVATDDGSVGEQGRVTQLLLRHLTTSKGAARDAEKNAGGSQDLTVYACGPWPMLRAVAELCARFQVRCQVSLEENMPCGIGVCNGCVVETTYSDNEYSMYRRICVEGPAVWAHEIKW